MLALKTALGVTLTTWASTNPCRLTGKSTPLQNEWTGVFCNLASSVESIYNWFDGTIPSTIASLPQLTTLGIFSNYLTGTMPIPSTSLVALDVGFNYLSGSFPKLSLAVCAADQNCFLNSSFCRTYGSLQRPATACAICGTTDGQGTLCSGGLCSANSSLPVSQGIVNTPSVPPVSLTCGNVSAMLSVKSSLGLTFTNWVSSSLCPAGGGFLPGGATTWNNVQCLMDGAPKQL
ncbi:unnamed protein product [Closterium sp. Naga37s-1]|nr:unnamed protein product [Closterium sp. Naga37s-1]